MGKNKEHVKLMCRGSNSTIALPAVCFGQAEMMRATIAEYYGHNRVEEIIDNSKLVNLKMDLVFKPAINEWKNTKTIQIQLLDYRISK